MKKKTNSKSLRKTVKASVHKRKSRERARAELLNLIEKTSVKTDALHISLREDGGRAARASAKLRRDEHLISGVFSSSKNGYGFVTPDEEYRYIIDRDVFIPEDKTAGVFDADTVEVIFHFYRTGYGEERTEGRIKRVLSYGRSTVIGTVERLADARGRGRGAPRRLYLIPDDPKIPCAIEIRDAMGASVGDKVEAVIVRGGNTVCEVCRNFGSAKSREANYAAVLAECEIPIEFSDIELSEAQLAARQPISYEGRKIPKDIIFTIDGPGAKDLDDAISLRKTVSGWLLGVHIADVSHYVTERTALDRAAMARGTSVYFTDKVVPMLPPSLSNGACSLNAGEEKYALSAFISLDSAGEIKSVRLEKTVIKSRVRGVYSEVNEIFLGAADEEIKRKYRDVIPTLMKMRELYIILAEKSRRRGAMELEGDEAEIILDEVGHPCEIIKRERGDAERLIEQFMLTANEGVARYLREREIPCVYRVHERPPEDKLEGFLSYMHNLGFDTSYISRDKCSPRDFSALLSSAEERGIVRPVSYAMLRAMSKARYSEVCSGHFGLSLKNYCHFTSPIRRLSDLATHRIITRVLFCNKSPELYKKYAYRAAAAATESELRALNAERRIENLYKVIYMSDKIGEVFDAVITSVTSFGFFAELENTCEGLVPIDELAGYFTFDEKNLTVRSVDTVYRIGDLIRVRLEEADIIRGKLRFSVCDFE